MVAVAGRAMAETGGGRTRPRQRRNRTTATPPLRLTRRGRIVVTGVSALMAGLLSVGLATAAQATRHGGDAGDPGRYVTRVVVRPGQNLWSLVEAYAPGMDPRQAIQQVLQLNSLATEQLWPGQVLWLPRD